MLCLLAFCLFAQAGDIEESSLRELLNIRRVYVDRLTGGETAAQMRDILITSMQGAKLFIVTENQERADAILRGAAEDLVFTESHNSSESLNAHLNLGSGRSSSSRGGYGAISAGESESQHATERRLETNFLRPLLFKKKKKNG